MSLRTVAAFCLAVASVATPFVVAPARAAPTAAETALAELRAAEQAASARAGTDLLAAAAAMFADDVTMPLPDGRFAEGREAALEALRANPANAGATAQWAPVRLGVSADGSHGFSFGFMEITRADGTRVPAKYLAYWERGATGWQVTAYKRAPRAEGPVDRSERAPSLPGAGFAADAARRDDHAASLAAAERAFSDQAQTIGVGPAFAVWGAEDAMNLGGPGSAEFTYGASTIGAQVGQGRGGPATIHWSSDRVRVAASGDLGVSIGVIRPNDPADPAFAGRPGIPFFTVWRRASPDAPWRYVAE